MTHRLQRDRPYLAALLWLLGTSTVARAEDGSSGYCDKVRARANGDAALLIAPRVVADALRFPGGGGSDVAPSLDRELQVRVGLSFAPIEAYRGFRLMDASEADCAAHESLVRAQRGLLT